MAQQTAVDWLQSKVLYIVPSSQKDDLLKLFEQAKQMEKEQIIKAYKKESAYMKHAGCTDKQINESAEQYYNETYGK